MISPDGKFPFLGNIGRNQSESRALIRCDTACFDNNMFDSNMFDNDASADLDLPISAMR